MFEGRNVGHPFRIKIDGRYGIEFSQRFLDGRRENLPNGLFVLKLDFGLGGMNVHINIGRLHIEVQEVGHLLTSRYQLFVSIHHRLMEVWMTHISAIDKEILTGTLLTGRFRTTHKTRNASHSSIHFHRK